MDGTISGMIIRALRAADLARLVEMDQKLTGRSRKTWFEGKLRRALDDSDLRISLGAELDGRLVGALLGSIHYGEFGLPEPVAVLDTILVDKKFSRHGLATAMFRQLRRNLSALGVTCLRTELGKEELSLDGFLRKQGFIPAPRTVLELALTTPPDRESDEAELADSALTPAPPAPR
jgi:GNAT superfamily N-acetyltransferase